MKWQVKLLMHGQLVLACLNIISYNQKQMIQVEKCFSTACKLRVNFGY